ncbi:MAG: tetraacyldisaccharide 4'-kinase [Parachlamydiales bacterium]|jgi:tetraacyldisaccharide 4'-kinase
MIFNKIKTDLFFYVKEVIDKKRKNSFLEFLLLFFSKFFEGVVSVKNFLFDKKILKAKKVNSTVISIGNIVAGGTGKTPFLILLYQKLYDKNKIAIVTRGYKSKFENSFTIVDKNSSLGSSEIGDEPFLLKNHLRDPHIFVGKNKYGSARKAAEMNFDVILIDDGFQYRKLHKDLEIILLNAKNPFGNNSFLPKGYLRENKKSLKRADYIVINNSDHKLIRLEEEIRKYCDKPIIYVKPYANKFLDQQKKEYIIEERSKVAIFCGIANPNLFYKTIKDQGLEIVNFLFLLDHEKISAEQLDVFIKKSIENQAEYIITTEKDFVKLDPDINSQIPILFLDISLSVVCHNDDFISLIEKINQISNN